MTTEEILTFKPKEEKKRVKVRVDVLPTDPKDNFNMRFAIVLNSPNPNITKGASVFFTLRYNYEEYKDPKNKMAEAIANQLEATLTILFEKFLRICGVK